MRVDIQIISFSKHFEWLGYCIKSISKYATGFGEVSIWVPNSDVREMEALRLSYSGAVPLKITGYDDWPEKGMLRHMDLIMRADQCCPEADFVLHTDSDCIFIEPVKPEDYFVDGKPVLMYARYEWLGRIEPAILCWQEVSSRALGWRPEYEMMRRHPAVHPKETYLLARQWIERNVNKLISDFIREQENGFPTGFAEFPTLGAYAWKYLSQNYHWINQETEPRPKDKIFQLWSHQSDFNAPMEVWHNDQKVTVIPNEIFKKYLD